MALLNSQPPRLRADVCVKGSITDGGEAHRAQPCPGGGIIMAVKISGEEVIVFSNVTTGELVMFQ